MLTKGKKDLVVVPFDFTDQSHTALLHASAIAAQNEDEVRLLHIIDANTPHRMKSAGINEATVEEALQKIAAENESAYGVITTFHATKGNFLTDIGPYIKASEARFGVMGTHGVHGIQHIVGAKSLKIVASSPAPIVIVQKRKIDEKGYKRIVLPVDGNKRGKNKIAYTAAMAKYFNSEVCIFEAHAEDQYVANRIEHNSQLATDYFTENGIKYRVEKEEPGKGTYPKQLIRYAGQLDADLAVISSHHDQEGVVDFFLSHHEVQIINNDLQMAVMCVNPVEPVEHLEIASFTW